MPNFVKKDDCIWFKHLSPDLRAVLSSLADSEPVLLKVNGQESAWCRMRSGPHGSTHGIRVTQGYELWRAIPRGTAFSLELGTGTSVTAISSESKAKRPTHQDLRQDSAERLFDEYLFADYSGAAKEYSQRKSIRVATAKPGVPGSVEPAVFTRESLLDWMHRKLLFATENGVRVCLGQDHSYGLPWCLAQELGIAGQPWRCAIASFLDGSYAADAPRFTCVPEFTAHINLWLRSRGFKDYFWSATKKAYGLPSSNPRARGDHESSWRITDRRKNSSGRGSPMPFSRVGDNGSVGGQALWGLMMLRRLITACEDDGILLRCWPCDGLAVTAEEYEDAHVLVEAYPSALRPAHVVQSDEADALCTVEALRLADTEGRLGQLLDLTGIADSLKTAVQFEGWIIGQNVKSD